MANEAIRWSHKDMIASTLEWWGDETIEASECEVIRDTDGNNRECLIVLHRPTGRTSTEAGDGGRWFADGRSYPQQTNPN